ncbi:MAG TPA: DUF6602 domain-containing protein [Chitinophagaceae bacterium]|nr:DUF6602 domain-containing protein [Chitinophagaceae bacterium]
MNKIITNLTIQNFKNFKDSFENTREVFWDQEKGKLIHPGEFGTYRETLAKKWLSIYIPEKFGLGNGFVITSKNRISTQCDIIIYDKLETPKIENVDSQKFYPIETVAGIIEVKSDINSTAELNDYLIKLSELKKMREDIEDPNPYHRGGFKLPYNLEKIPFDNIFTILICNKFNFELDVNKISYDAIPIKYHHNLILSLNDGIINYSTPKGTPNLSFSYIGNVTHNYNFLKNDGDSNLPNSVINFLVSLHYLLLNTCLHRIDMSFYMVEDPLKVII